MPCSDNFTDEQERQKVVKALDERTDMLCRLCRIIKATSGSLSSVPLDIRKWYSEHEKFDKSEGR